jgi:N-methylhydantoinase A
VGAPARGRAAEGRAVALIVGIDTGGTFTDIVAADPDTGAHLQHKLRSTPDDPARAVLEGLRELGLDLGGIARLVHGTTVATNTIIERRGARTGLLTTAGHRDMARIRRGNKPESDVFNLLWLEPEPLAPRYRCVDVAGRLDAYGREVEPLALDEVEAAADHLVAQDVESVAICFLFSYLNGEHEQRAAELLRERHPALELSLSSEILPQWREYERAATTIADAYIKPTLARYLASLEVSLAEAGCTAAPLIMKSNGGVMTARTARRRPIETFLSGPAGGVVAARAHGRGAGRDDLIAIDVGGTSFDVSLITAGEPETTTQGWIDDSTPVSLSMLDIRTIGAGGGSVAWIDRGGALKVGPRSAGAVPGPACYGTGGSEPTVTDANLVLGRLGARTLLGGRLELHSELAAAALERAVCAPLGLDLLRAAAGVVRICVANMAGEIRALTAERGVNPRDYGLLAGGGAGPLHAVALAREFGIADVLVPAHPGLLSAGGLVLSDLRVDRLRSFPARLERTGAGPVLAAAAALLEEAVDELRSEGSTAEPEALTALDMRYVGQNWDLTVPLALVDATTEAVAAAFDREHERLYGFSLPGHPHEVLAIRASAVGATAAAPALSAGRARPPAGRAVPVTTRQVYDDGPDALVPASVYAWDDLPEGFALRGPAVVEGRDSTVWLPAGTAGTVDDGGHLLLRVDTGDFL